MSRRGPIPAAAAAPGVDLSVGEGRRRLSGSGRGDDNLDVAGDVNGRHDLRGWRRIDAIIVDAVDEVLLGVFQLLLTLDFLQPGAK